MSKYYFLNNFPIIKYNGFNAINILARTAFVKSLKSNSSNFFHYKIQDGMRPDVVSYQVYGDSSYDWIIYLINDIQDRFYDWPLNEDDFDAMIIDKYGSIDLASQKILFWASNWYDDTTVLTPAAYTALTDNLKKYYAPIIVSGNRVLEYRRSTMDIVRTTNQINNLVFNTAPTTAYVVGDIITQTANTTAQGTVTWASKASVQIQHVFGTWTDGIAYNIKNQNGITANATSTLLQTVIPSDELVYYSAVDAYTEEQTMNNKKSFILLLRPELLSVAENAFAQAMAGAPNI